MNENELVRNLLAKDPAAIRILVDRYQPLVLKTARHFVRNTEDARDIAQDVFIDIITNLGRFRGQSVLSTWIYRITVNRSLNYLRSIKRRPHPVRLDDQEVLTTAAREKHLSDPGVKNPAELLEQQDRARILHSAIDSLPQKQQIAFKLAEFDDLSYKEIAEVMKVTIASVESLLFRARQNLQKKLWHCYKNSC